MTPPDQNPGVCPAPSTAEADWPSQRAADGPTRPRTAAEAHPTRRPCQPPPAARWRSHSGRPTQHATDRPDHEQQPAPTQPAGPRHSRRPRSHSGGLPAGRSGQRASRRHSRLETVKKPRGHRQESPPRRFPTSRERPASSRLLTNDQPTPDPSRVAGRLPRLAGRRLVSRSHLARRFRLPSRPRPARRVRLRASPA